MKKIGDIDINFAEKPVIKDGMIYYNIIKNENFKIYGLYKPEEGTYKRMPPEIGENVNDGVKVLYKHTAGGRVRFKTNSQKITLKCYFPSVGNMSHMPMTGIMGFDLFADGEYYKTFSPILYSYEKFCMYEDGKRGYESTIEFPNIKERDILINFPLYNPVDEVYIAIEEGAELKKGNEYKYKTPVVYLGSSITQGGCASRPGNSYQAMLSNWLDTDYINLGFSGSCRGEDIMAEYIREIPMSVFVYDYDHNAPNAEHLRKTHERFFLKFREKQPTTPVIMISVADKAFGDTIDRRREVIYATYKNAVDRGDKNVYFLNGQDFYREPGFGVCTVDGCHPNDIGFYYMAKGIKEVLKDLL
ncbi:MAG: hypothetical protein E7564_05555 [Ruminococcaceae bacterium]|nr:hypothetical protein [Oscillospiraceae bacterium]